MNIAQNVERAAARLKDHPAILFEGKSVSYATLDYCASALADALTKHGVRRGDRVALYLPNIPAFALAYLAGLKAGAIVVSINSIFKWEEVRHIVNDSRPKVLFTTAELLPNVPRPECPSIEHTVICEGAEPGEIALEDWLARGDPATRAADMRPDDAAVLLYSSGTTGVPKGVTLTHNNVATNVRTAARCSGYGPTDRLALFLPLFHVFGQNYIMNAGFDAGATLAMFRRFAPEPVLKAIGRDRITKFFAVPTIYIGLLNTDLAEYDLSSIDYYFSAAATMPEEISRRWTERFGRRVYEGYGLTECSPFACYNHAAEHRFGSVGTAVEGFMLAIHDEEGNEVPRGQWGEIVIRGPGVMKGYWGRPEDTDQALRGGWLHSGDIGRMDEDGYVYIVDRVKDMVNVSGFKVWPAEVEQVLYRHPAVQEVAVYGAPDALKGEQVRAAIVLKAGERATAEALAQFCRDRLAAYKIPARVDLVDALPKSATGKILKRVLRDQAAQA
jgi:long-chain acyl-CoA synthetase